MSIDTSGKWWVGTDPQDMKEYLEAYSEQGYKVQEFRLSKCQCGSLEFHLDADDAEGAAKRACTKCKREYFICDSKEFWDEAEPEHWSCNCGSEATNVGVGFSLRKRGILGCFAGWKIDYAPSRHVLEQV